MTRTIAVLDVETTGVDPDKDRIIDLAICFIENGQIDPAPVSFRFNPGIPIPPEATAVHGIRNEDVEGFPPFSAAASEIAVLLTGVDIAGFHPRLLDLPLLAQEFEYANVEWDFNGNIFDVAGIFMKMNPRDLSAAVRHYLGREHDGAHGALADTIATAQVFIVQTAVAHPELGMMEAEQLARFCQRDDLELIDLSGRLARRADGEAIFTFGKNKDKTLRSCRDYCAWMMRSNFPKHTKRKLQAELDHIDGLRTRETEPGKDAIIPF
jgi:DNA polymerase-3 subunit epsilon